MSSDSRSDFLLLYISQFWYSGNDVHNASYICSRRANSLSLCDWSEAPFPCRRNSMISVLSYSNTRGRLMQNTAEYASTSLVDRSLSKMDPRRGAMYSVDVVLASSSISGSGAVGAFMRDELDRCTICCCAMLRCVALRFAATLAMLLGDIRHTLE